MCLNNLIVGESGPACPTCSTSNPKGAHFCRNCGAILEASGTPRVPNSAELAAMVMEAVGGLGVTAGPTTALGPSDFDEGEVGDFVDEGEDLLAGPIEEAQEFAPPPPAPVGKPEVTEVPQAAIPGPILEAPAEPAMPEIDLDEDFAPPPPPGVVSPAEQELTLPPLGAEEEEEFAPPPPPGVVLAADAFAAPPPPPGVVEADEYLPPPPPPGALDAEAALAPPPPPPGAVEPAQELVPPPPPPPPGAEEKKPEEGDNEFGDWELDFESEEDDKKES
jgi:hypothetical protein